MRDIDPAAYGNEELPEDAIASESEEAIPTAEEPAVVEDDPDDDMDDEDEEDATETVTENGTDDEDTPESPETAPEPAAEEASEGGDLSDLDEPST
jgi:hypothetical protein